MGVGGHRRVAIDGKRRRGVDNLYANAMYPVIYENISPLDYLLIKYGYLHLINPLITKCFLAILNTYSSKSS